MSILIPVFHNTGDFTYFTGAIMTMIKILIRMLFLVVVIVKNIPNATKETFMKYFIFSCCLYICSTIIMLIVPSIRSMFWELVKESESAKAMALEARYQTRYGWGGFSGFEYTFKCVMEFFFYKLFSRYQYWCKKSLVLGSHCPIFICWNTFLWTYWFCSSCIDLTSYAAKVIDEKT